VQLARQQVRRNYGAISARTRCDVRINPLVRGNTPRACTLRSTLASEPSAFVVPAQGTLDARYAAGERSAVSSSSAVVSLRAAIVCACMLVAAGSPAAGQDRSVPADAVFRSFDARVAQYAALRTKFEAPLPAFDDARRDPWALLIARRYLASAMRTARQQAGQGCIFGSAAEAFRRIIARAVDEIDMEGLFDEGGESGGFVLDLTLNEPIPAWALSRVPAALAERLPPLPAAIEYRIAGGALILWDAHAEILIDALPDAFVAP
jgi:hypothetical protein